MYPCSRGLGAWECCVVMISHNACMCLVWVVQLVLRKYQYPREVIAKKTIVALVGKTMRVSSMRAIEVLGLKAIEVAMAMPGLRAIAMRMPGLRVIEVPDLKAMGVAMVIPGLRAIAIEIPSLRIIEILSFKVMGVPDLR